MRNAPKKPTASTKLNYTQTHIQTKKKKKKDSVGGFVLSVKSDVKVITDNHCELRYVCRHREQKRAPATKMKAEKRACECGINQMRARW